MNKYPKLLKITPPQQMSQIHHNPLTLKLPVNSDDLYRFH